MLRLLPIALALVAGACSGGNDSPTAPTNPGGGNTVHYTVLGASDGVGVGGSIVCAPFDRGCENGTGYAQTIRRRFQADGRSVTFDNLSVPGYVLSRAVADLALSLGRPDPGNFIERYPPFVPPTTTHITIFVGGNDANVIGSAVSAGAGGGDQGPTLTARCASGVTISSISSSRVRTRAPNARIVAYNLPNLGAAPYLAGRTVLERSIMQRIVTGLSDQVNC